MTRQEKEERYERLIREGKLTMFLPRGYMPRKSAFVFVEVFDPSSQKTKATCEARIDPNYSERDSLWWDADDDSDNLNRSSWEDD